MGAAHDRLGDLPERQATRSRRGARGRHRDGDGSRRPPPARHPSGGRLVPGSSGAPPAPAQPQLDPRRAATPGRSRRDRRAGAAAQPRPALGAASCSLCTPPSAPRSRPQRGGCRAARDQQAPPRRPRPRHPDPWPRRGPGDRWARDPRRRPPPLLAAVRRRPRTNPRPPGRSFPLSPGAHDTDRLRSPAPAPQFFRASRKRIGGDPATTSPERKAKRPSAVTAPRRKGPPPTPAVSLVRKVPSAWTA